MVHLYLWNLRTWGNFIPQNDRLLDYKQKRQNKTIPKQDKHFSFAKLFIIT